MENFPSVKLTEILRWKRPSGSSFTQSFCDKYLLPVMGEPDVHGNYTCIIYKTDGSHPNVCFTAHHDTVHRDEGMQHVLVEDDMITAVGSSCLGADCGTGVWLILGMIEAHVPGVYVIFANEEIGCVGSGGMVKDGADWISKVDAMISFDRKGYTSIITHQLSSRTCSDTFGNSLAEVLGDNLGYVLDTGGAYTDSNEFVDLIGECTNLSVGYFNQHSSRESQDLNHAYDLLETLITADWSKLEFHRQPGEVDPEDAYWGKRSAYWDNKDDSDYAAWWDDPTLSVQTTYGGRAGDKNVDNLGDLIKNFPDELAQVLDEWGVDAEYLYDSIKPYVRSYPYTNRKIG